MVVPIKKVNEIALTLGVFSIFFMYQIFKTLKNLTPNFEFWFYFVLLIFFFAFSSWLFTDILKIILWNIKIKKRSLQKKFEKRKKTNNKPTSDFEKTNTGF